MIVELCSKKALFLMHLYAAFSADHIAPSILQKPDPQVTED